MSKPQSSFLQSFGAWSRQRNRHRARPHGARPRLEFLEDRRLLATSVATFEDLGLAPNSFDNNAGSSGQFVENGDSFNNSFDSTFDSWSGWAISSTTDTTTAGYTNQYSAITGSGANGSQTYAVAFTFDGAANPLHPADSFVNLASGASPASIQVTNTTYAYLSMLNGDSFENKFGSGDFFQLTIAGYTGPEGTGTKVGEVDFYLANFLGSNHSIVNTWQTLDLTPLAGAASLQFGLDSSMNDPVFGINTPTYFAVDNLTVSTTAPPTGTVSGVVFNDANDDGVQDNGEGGLQNWVVQLYNGSNLVASSSPTGSNGAYSISGVAPGSYTLREVLQNGYAQTAPPAPGSYSVTVPAGGTVTGDNFGNVARVLTGLAVTPADPSIAKGLTEPFTATATYADNSTQDVTGEVTWASADPSVATITTAGVATGVATGTSTISATLNGVTGSTVETVTAPSLSSIAVTPSSPSLAQGQAEPFMATGTYSDDSTQDLTSQVVWASATPTVASVTTAGVATAVAPGMSTMSATLDGVTGSTVLTVTPALVSIAVTPSNPNVAAGLTEPFTATGTYSDDSTQDLTGEVTWASATPSIATISSAGLAAGLALGTSTITASLGGVSGSTLLTVTAPLLVSIAVSPTNPSVAQGLTESFNATGTYTDDSTRDLTNQVTWSSATPTSATITSAGVATGLAAGPVTITATLNDVSGATVLTITAPLLVSIAVTPANPTIAVGLSEQFTATGTYTDDSTQELTGQVTWTSAPPAVSSISAAGLSTGLAIGSSAITATLEGVSGATVLMVTAPSLVSIAVTPSNPSVAAGLSQQFTATGTYSDHSTQDLTGQVAWSSGTPSVAAINAAGLAVSAATGSTTITAALNGVTASTALTVTAASLASIVVTPANPSLARDLTEQFTATGTYTDNSTQDLTSHVTWASAAPSVATITTAGLATSLAPGIATISATLDGLTGSTILTAQAASLISIAVTPSDPSVAKGLTEQFTATGSYSDDSTHDLTSQVAWTSDTPSVATITAAGFATGVAPGASTITAALNGVTGSTALTVTAASLVSIAVTSSNPGLAKGLSQQFTATGTYSDNSTQDLTSQVTWNSDTPTVVGINTAGLATGEATGTSTISAALSGVTGATVETVTPASLVSIAVTPANPSIVKGLAEQFTATGIYTDNSSRDLTTQVSWSSDTPAGTVVSGLATGAATGTSTIFAALNGVTGSTSLTVTPPSLVSIAVTPSNASLAVGSAQQFTATGTYSDFSTQDLTSQVTWTSAAPAVAVVSTAGLATGLATGNATVAANLDGVTASRRLTVTAATSVPATSPVTITSLRVEKVKHGTGHHVKKALVLLVQFSGSLSSAAAQNLAAYIDLSGAIKKVHKLSQVVYRKVVPLIQAMYDPSTNSVTLVPRGRRVLPKFEQLQVNVSLLTDPAGRPINNGANFNATVTNTGLVISSSRDTTAREVPDLRSR